MSSNVNGNNSLVQGPAVSQLPRLKLHPIHTQKSKENPVSLNVARFARGDKHSIAQVMKDSLLALQLEKLLPQEATENWRNDCLDVHIGDYGSANGKLQFIHPAAAAAAAASDRRGGLSPRAARPIHEMNILASHLDFYVRSARPVGASGLNDMPIILVAMTKGVQIELKQLSEDCLWAVVVDGNETELYKLLNALGKMGAIRHDLSKLYSVHEQIGVGGSSNVFVGLRQISAPRISDKAARLDQQVALKMTAASSGEDVHKKVIQEVSMQLACQNHPNIVKIMGVFWNTDLGEQRWVLAQSLGSGGDLYDFVRETSPVPEHSICKIMAGLISAIAHVHVLRIAHRDIKPENVLLNEEARPMLCDFGISANIDDPVRASLVCGSPGYIAPEALHGSMICHTSADIFSVGCVLFYILTGKSPFASASGNMKELLHNNAACRVAWQAINRTVYSSLSLHDLLQELLRQQPDDRPIAKAALQHAFVYSFVNTASAAPAAASAPSLARERPSSSAASATESRKGSGWMSSIPSRLKSFVSTPRGTRAESSKKADKSLNYQVLDENNDETKCVDKEVSHQSKRSWSLGKEYQTTFAGSDQPQELKVTPWPAEVMLYDGGRIKPFSFQTKNRSPALGGGKELSMAEYKEIDEGPASLRQITNALEVVILEPDFLEEPPRLDDKDNAASILGDEDALLSEMDAARGNVYWWKREQGADREGRRSAPQPRDLRHSFGVCEFQTVDGPNGRRHLVRMLDRRRNRDDDDADDDSDNESWHSWRRPPSIGGGFRRTSSVNSRGSSGSRASMGSMASIESRESGIAMREFLQRGFGLSEYQQDLASAVAGDDNPTAVPVPVPPSSARPARNFQRGRGGACQGNEEYGEEEGGEEETPDEQRNPLMARPLRDWGTSQFYQESAGPGQRPRRMVQALHHSNVGEDQHPASASSWRSLASGAAPPRSSESFQSNDSGLPLNSESGLRMMEHLQAAQARQRPSPFTPRGSDRSMARNPDAGLYENSISVEARAAATGPSPEN